MLSFNNYQEKGNQNPSWPNGYYQKEKNNKSAKENVKKNIYIHIYKFVIIIEHCVGIQQDLYAVINYYVFI